MRETLVECVPNFSEGRRSEVIKKIREEITRVPGISILDQHTDKDHNRTVITFIGSADAVEEAGFRMIRTAAKHIDMNEQEGEHPRIGAADVIPFVPISGVSLDECVGIARRLGQRVGEDLQIPVYLYEAAALRKDRIKLEDIRRGQYETLKQTIGSDPYRKPDYGPSVIGSAGASVIGARDFLIAYNIFLTTKDVKIAKRIAAAVRNSTGGMRYLKAIGILVDGKAQVSLNFTNFNKTPIYRVTELVRIEAERYGVQIQHSELVGLIPQKALIDSAIWYLQLDQFKHDQILETKIRES